MGELRNLKIWACYYYHQMGFNITHICPELNKIRDKERGIFKNPYKSSTNDRTTFHIHRQNSSELDIFHWEKAVGIGTVTGLNSLRALDFDCLEINEAFISKILQLLNLPQDYEWVVKSGSGYGFHIIFYSDHFKYAIDNITMRSFYPNNSYIKKFENIDLVWYNHLILPPSVNRNGNPYYYSNCEYPNSKPLFVNIELIEKLIDELCYENGGFNTHKNHRSYYATPVNDKEIIINKVDYKRNINENKFDNWYGVPISDSRIIINKSEYEEYLKKNNIINKKKLYRNSEVIYYSNTAESLDNVYKKATYKLGLEKLREYLKKEFANKTIIEIACGNGFWTNILSNFCKSIVATDINTACLEEAKKNVTSVNVTFELSDCFNLRQCKPYDGLFGGFIISHIERSKLKEFFISMNQVVKIGGTIILFDNRFVPNNNMDIHYTSETGNTYQQRFTKANEDYLIIKNFFEFEELKQKLQDIAYDLDYIKLKYFWALKYKVK